MLVIKQAFSTWDCVGFTDPHNAGFHISILRDYPTVDCEIAAQTATFPSLGTAAILGLTYTLGAIPVIALILRRRRSKLRTDKATIALYGSLYMRYEPKFYYWEILVLCRKALLVYITRVLSGNPLAQVLCTGALMGGSLVLTLVCRPFLCPELDKMELWLLSGCVALVSLGALCRFASLSGLVVALLYYGTLALVSWGIAVPMWAIWNGEEPMTFKGAARCLSSGMAAVACDVCQKCPCFCPLRLAYTLLLRPLRCVHYYLVSCPVRCVIRCLCGHEPPPEEVMIIRRSKSAREHGEAPTAVAMDRKTRLII